MRKRFLLLLVICLALLLCLTACDDKELPAESGNRAQAEQSGQEQPRQTAKNRQAVKPG